jgi:hypothetical protein
LATLTLALFAAIALLLLAAIWVAAAWHFFV